MDGNAEPESSQNDGRSARSTAPVHSVLDERMVSIEHPCIVKNFDNGFKSLGGEAQLKHVSTLKCYLGSV